MSRESIEIRNPFTSGKVVAKNYDQRLYTKQEFKRGDPRYVMSRSDLVDFATCPSKWLRGAKDDEDDTKATEWGSLIDSLIFDKNRFSERYAIKPAQYPSVVKGVEVMKPWNANSTWCDEWLTAQGDKVCIKQDLVQSTDSAIARLHEEPQVHAILGASDFQVYCTADYKDRETGIVVPVKCLIDILPSCLPDTILDFKTGKSANPKFWAREVHSHGYDVQAGMSIDIYNAATGEQRNEFRHIVQESYPPYEVSKPLLSSEFVELGKAKMLNALKRYAQCLKTNVWPSYDDPDQYGGWSLVEPEIWMYPQ